jgi:hypothetical protein
VTGAAVERRQHIGYFEEFLLLRGEQDWPKGLGFIAYPVDLPPEQQGRPLGFAGRRELVLTADVVLQKGHRPGVIVRASPQRPKRVTTMLQRMEGKVIHE